MVFTASPSRMTPEVKLVCASVKGFPGSCQLDSGHPRDTPPG